MKTSIEKFVERTEAIKNMMCDKEFNTIGCKGCSYFYIHANSKYTVSRCLKRDILDWCLYRIESEDKE